MKHHLLEHRQHVQARTQRDDCRRSGSTPLSLSIWAFLCVGFIFNCLLVTGWLQELQPRIFMQPRSKAEEGPLLLMCLFKKLSQKPQQTFMDRIVSCAVINKSPGIQWKFPWQRQEERALGQQHHWLSPLPGPPVPALGGIIHSGAIWHTYENKLDV